MRDCFALLQEPRRPWLEPELLKQKFLALSSESHPDRVHGKNEAERRAAQEHYTELNAAYRCLLEPKDRLRHLIELETGAKPGDLQTIPDDLIQLFQQVGRRCREADSLIAQKRSASSPLLKVQLFERCQEAREALVALATEINLRRDGAVAELQRLDAQWSPANAAATREDLKPLESLYRLFGYYSRWLGQMQERILQLSL